MHRSTMSTIKVPRTLFADDFAAGLDLGTSWQFVTAGPFVADDGVATKTSSGISVAPPARNPVTAEPMFTKDESGTASHLKWMVTSTQAFATAGHVVRARFRAGARSFGTFGHPYGQDAADPESDIRLGAASLNVLDFESGLVFDFWIGNRTIVPMYERLRLPGMPGDYAAFTSVTEPISREPDAVNEFSVVVDTAKGAVSWEIDGQIVAVVERTGPPAPGWATVLDHGGIPRDATPRQLLVGLGLMTLLDASRPPSPRGLVHAGVDLVSPTEFHGGPTLFGQGVQLDVEDVRVEAG